MSINELKPDQSPGGGVFLPKARRRRGLTVFVILFLIAISSVEAQCSMCRAVLESEAKGTAAEGINNGILYLMAIPYLVVGAIFFFVYKKLRK